MEETSERATEEESKGTDNNNNEQPVFSWTVWTWTGAGADVIIAGTQKLSATGSY